MTGKQQRTRKRSPKGEQQLTLQRRHPRNKRARRCLYVKWQEDKLAKAFKDESSSVVRSTIMFYDGELLIPQKCNNLCLQKPWNSQKVSATQFLSGACWEATELLDAISHIAMSYLAGHGDSGLSPT
ncbi:hypothetical protein Pelo_8080 [Pelomyxa schiedti]|nr:hypothetical protein Pelo_8080 [Pelomyxa schiedti]